jgi:Cu(I)/Ag(I) efflux system membrane fusion protein
MSRNDATRSGALRLAIGAVVVIAAFAAGYLLRGVGRGAPTTLAEAHEHDATTPGLWTCPMHPEVQQSEPGSCPSCKMDLVPLEAAEDESVEAAPEFWTCSMHPQIRLPEPGSCPLCKMDLIPVVSEGGEESERELTLSETARRLAEVRTVPVKRALATVEVRMVGKVEYDETRIGFIASYVPGRLERMFVDYTGVTVNRGDHMVDIYSPQLIAAQDELLLAIETQQRLGRSELEIMRRTAAQTVTAAREKLRLWGLLPEQIQAIEARGGASELITLYSPLTGVVIEKHANQGSYVETGSRIYTIVDLDHLWVRLEAYESDIEWVHLGQEVEFSTEAYPGTIFRGRVSFIDPVLDPNTRTVKLRVNVSNEDQRLKPEMLVRAVVNAKVAGAGRVFDPYLAGKWIGPMHPEIVRDEAGDCPVCGMPLVRAESLGFAAESEPAEAPLVIPATAPLITGKRAVVYVESREGDRTTYEGREIRLGPKAGDLYIVRDGLAEGERVVVEGNFKIDSALQIQARPSMMSPEGGVPAPVHEHGHDPAD